MTSPDTYPPLLPALAEKALREWYAKDSKDRKALTGAELDEQVTRVMRCQFPGWTSEP
jgi:hypothetical protein